MRVVLFIVSMVIFFFLGVNYAQDNQRIVSVEPVSIEPLTQKEITSEQIEVESQENLVITEADTTPAFKAASALEAVVNFLYEIIIELLYQVSKLFY